MLTLRPYQQKAIDAVYHHLRTRDDNPCVVLPTAAGKTPVLATICRDAVTRWNGRVLVLAHVKELLEQAADKLRAICPEVPVGVYSAGLGRRDTGQPVIVAGIQSVYQRACELDRFDVILIDEGQLIPLEGDGMYRQFLSDAKVINPNVRLIGLTATPYRLKGGAICGPDNLLNAICYEVGVKELIGQGYLCPLKTKAGQSKADTTGLHLRGGEFVASEVEDLVNQGDLVWAACREIVDQTADRKSVLIFAASVAHAERVKAALEAMTGQEVGLVTGDSKDRDLTLHRFKGEKIPVDLFGHSLPPLKFLVNVNVLAVGFDAPNIDCVVLLRPTASPGLYYQMVGRGFRLHPAKTDCLILDYGSNIVRHGPVDSIEIGEKKAGQGGEAPAKECPECQNLMHAGLTACPDCGYQFPPPDRQQHESTASDEGVLSGQVIDTEYDVKEMICSTHTKRGADESTPKTLRVDYRVSLNDYHSEWICVEHDGWARRKAESWWYARSNEACPDTAEMAADIAAAGGLAETRKITVRKITGERFDRIIKHELGEKPVLEIPLEDIPF